MKKQIPVLAVLLLMILLIVKYITDSGISTGTGSYRQISMEEAVTMMGEKDDYLILDVRTAEEYEEKHIPGAVNIPNEAISTTPVPALPDKDQLILIYCRSGNRSKQAAQKLADLGYTNIVEFGGILHWTGATVSGTDSSR